MLCILRNWISSWFLFLQGLSFISNLSPTPIVRVWRSLKTQMKATSNTRRSQLAPTGRAQGSGRYGCSVRSKIALQMHVVLHSLLQLLLIFPNMQEKLLAFRLSDSCSAFKVGRSTVTSKSGMFESLKLWFESFPVRPQKQRPRCLPQRSAAEVHRPLGDVEPCVVLGPLADGWCLSGGSWARTKLLRSAASRVHPAFFIWSRSYFCKAQGFSGVTLRVFAHMTCFYSTKIPLFADTQFTMTRPKKMNSSRWMLSTAEVVWTETYMRQAHCSPKKSTEFEIGQKKCRNWILLEQNKMKPTNPNADMYVDKQRQYLFVPFPTKINLWDIRSSHTEVTLL